MRISITLSNMVKLSFSRTSIPLFLLDDGQPKFSAWDLSLVG